MFVLKDVEFKDILDIDSLEVPGNKITCIVGPSGAGKSTMLKLLNNLISPDKGEVLYKGNNVKALDPIKLRREVMMLGQKSITFEGSVKDNLEIPFRWLDREVPDDGRLKDILNDVRLNVGLDKGASNLSGGEKQRLSLARILLLRPEVLLLDEPSSALDEETENLVIEKVVDYVKEKDKTLIMITHSKSIARDYGDRIIEMEAGQIVEEEELR
ncbi:ABC transporter ATP-binding protein [Halonatronum saccharophilum]|uniref:ABC transporter ATP-binding protein n=1 Tax=Halonatronum saccharophilum TaxID=150060 RepID=UPI000488A7CC|nr:ATP-binding cassette domain-containing protein [Halonatronum saccharophilum]